MNTQSKTPTPVSIDKEVLEIDVFDKHGNFKTRILNSDYLRVNGLNKVKSPIKYLLKTNHKPIK